MNFKLSTKKMWWKMHFEGKKKKERSQFLLFPFHTPIRKKKQGKNQRNIRSDVRSINIYKRI